LLYQLGVAAAAVFAFYLWIARIAWRLYRATGAPALAFASSAIAVTLVNGLFQEEAYFAPLALGLVMGFAGLALGATDRAIVPLLAGARPDATPPSRSDRHGEHYRVAAPSHRGRRRFQDRASRASITP
jgi:ABC-type phosphate/phosphonate transport system permease subunit